MVQQDISKAISTASGLSEAEILRHLMQAKELSKGDYSLPCFPFAKALSKNPAALAGEIAAKLILPDSFEKVEQAGPYLNFFLKRSPVIEATINRALSGNLGKSPNITKQKLLVEYSAPNIAKTLHVGHLRTTLIGLCLERVLRHLGHDVETINHIGDWGTQFGFVYAGISYWGKPTEVNIDSLVDIYRKATNLRKQQDEKSVPDSDKTAPDMNQAARDYFLRLESGDKEATDFWKWCLEISVKHLNEVYDRLGIKFDHTIGESFFNDKLAEVEDWIKNSGILEDSNGAKGVDLGKSLGFVRIFTEDGRSLYITRDIAAAKWRCDTFSPDDMLYVVAAQQTLHFQQLKGVLEKLDSKIASRVTHIPFGFVPGMKTREGGAISLSGYLDEAKDRAKKAYQEEVEKRPEGIDVDEVAEKVAIGATYFYFLNHSNAKDFQFSWDEALSFTGDSGPYLQYALARLYGIDMKAKSEGIDPNVEDLNPGLLNENDAYEIICSLRRFEEVLSRVATEHEPVILSTWLLELARAVSKSYKSLRVIGEESKLAASRLILYRAARNALQTGLYLLGAPTLERM